MGTFLNHIDKNFFIYAFFFVLFSLIMNYYTDSNQYANYLKENGSDFLSEKGFVTSSVTKVERDWWTGGYVHFLVESKIGSKCTVKLYVDSSSIMMDDLVCVNCK